MDLKKTALKAVKLLIALAGIGAVFYFGRISVSELVNRFSYLKPAFFAISLVLVVFVILAGTVRWSILLKTQGRPVSFMKLANLNFIGSFFNLFLPSSFGGDLIRGVYLQKEAGSWKMAVSSVFLDRFLGLLGLFLLAFFSLLFKALSGEAAGGKILIYLLAGTALLFAGWLLLMNLHTLIRKLFRTKNATLTRYLSQYELFSESINLSAYPKADIIKGLVSSVVANLISAVSIYFLSLSLDLQIGIIPILIIFPLVTVISMIPVSAGGLGLREGAFVFFLSGYGVPATNAVALSLLYYLTIVFLGLIGGVIFSFSKYKFTRGVPQPENSPEPGINN